MNVQGAMNGQGPERMNGGWVNGGWVNGGTFQRGSASLIGLALCAFVMMASLVTADIGALAFARARAQTAADLAVLAAVTPYAGISTSAHSDRSPTGAAPTGAAPTGAAPTGAAALGTPMDRAQAIARANGADVITCACGPLEATARVRVRAVLIPFGTTVEVNAYARAVLPVALDPSPPASARSGGGHVR